MKIGVIGAGNIGGTLGAKWAKEIGVESMLKDLASSEILKSREEYRYPTHI